MLWPRKTTSANTPGKPTRKPTRLSVETLEAREVLYSASGNAWPHPELITISFVPDGTVVGSNANGPILSNLFATMNARFGNAATWQNEILKAAQVWAQQTNINFKLVADDGAEIGTGNYQQGDPNHGDIRISGYAMGNTSSDPLATSYMPPPVNNYDIAGDMQINTSRTWNINAGTALYDLFTVTAHEFGHTLGLNHSNNTTGATTSGMMWDAYTNRKTALAPDDINGIRAVGSWTTALFSSPGYGGARAADTYDAAAANGTLAAASTITSAIGLVSKTAVLANMEISSATDSDFYKFVVPAGMGGTLTVKLQSEGLSLLSPTLTLYNGSQQQQTYVTGAGVYGATLTGTLSVTGGQTYYIKVAGAESTVLGTGKYALTFGLAGVGAPSVTLPDTKTINAPIGGGGGGMSNRGGDLLMMVPVRNTSTPTGCGCGTCAGGVAALQSRGPEMQLQHLNTAFLTSPATPTPGRSAADDLAQLPMLLAAGNFGDATASDMRIASPADDVLERADADTLAWQDNTGEDHGSAPASEAAKGRKPKAADSYFVCAPAGEPVSLLV